MAVNVSDEAVYIPVHELAVEGLQWFSNEDSIRTERGLRIEPGKSIVGLEKGNADE